VKPYRETEDDQDPRPSADPGPDAGADVTALTERHPWRLPDHHIRICKLGSCQGDAGGELARALEEQLGISLNERTPDGAISLEALECIGLCDIRQSVAIDDAPVIGRDKILRAVDDLLR